MKDHLTVSNFRSRKGIELAARVKLQSLTMKYLYIQVGPSAVNSLQQSTDSLYSESLRIICY